MNNDEGFYSFVAFALALACAVVGWLFSSRYDIPMEKIGYAIEVCEGNGGLKSLDRAVATCMNAAQFGTHKDARPSP